MRLSLPALVRLTLTEPQRAAAYVKEHTPSQDRALEFALLVVALGAFVSALLAPLSGSADLPGIGALVRNPLLLAIVDYMVLLITVVLVHVIGRMFSGRGRFEEAVMLVAWLQFVMICFQIAIAFVSWVLPPLANPSAFAANLFAVWLLARFVAVLHGFRSHWGVLGGIVLAALVVAFIMGLLLGLLGLSN